jgi:hypothetical protein
MNRNNIIILFLGVLFTLNRSRVLVVVSINEMLRIC